MDDEEFNEIFDDEKKRLSQKKLNSKCKKI